MIVRAPSATLFPYTTLFRSYFDPRSRGSQRQRSRLIRIRSRVLESTFSSASSALSPAYCGWVGSSPSSVSRSEEHTSELQSRLHLVCRLLLDKKSRLTCS